MRKFFYSNVQTIGVEQGVPKILSVECQQTSQIPRLDIVGMSAKTAVEVRLRTLSALVSCGFAQKSRRTTINFRTKALFRPDSSYDLPVAIAILQAQGVVSATATSKFLFLGSLNLDSSLNEVLASQFLPAVLPDTELLGAIVPNSTRCLPVGRKKLLQFSDLRAVVEFLQQFSDNPHRFPPQKLKKQGSESAKSSSEHRKFSKTAVRLAKFIALTGHSAAFSSECRLIFQETAKVLSILRAELSSQEQVQTAVRFTFAGYPFRGHRELIFAESTEFVSPVYQKSNRLQALSGQILAMTDADSLPGLRFEQAVHRLLRQIRPAHFLFLDRDGDNSGLFPIYIGGVQSSPGEYLLTREDARKFEQLRQQFCSEHNSDSRVMESGRLTDRIRLAARALACVDGQLEPTTHHLQEARFYLKKEKTRQVSRH